MPYLILGIRIDTQQTNLFKLRSVLIASQQDAASPSEKLQLIENSLPSDIDAS